MDPIPVLQGVLPPILLALIACSIGGVRLLPLAAAGGALVAYGLLKQWPALPHELWTHPNGTEWLLWSLAAAALVATLEHLRLLPPRAAAPIACLVAVAAVHFVLVKVAASWSASDTALHVGVGAAAAAALVLAPRRTLANARPGMFPLVLFSVVLSLDAALVTLGKSALLGQLCGAVAAAAGAAAGSRLWRKDVAAGAADAIWLGLAHGLFLLAGVHLAYLPLLPAVLAASALLLPLLLPAGLWTTRPRTAAALTAGLMLAPQLAAIGVLLAASESGGY